MKAPSQGAEPAGTLNTGDAGGIRAVADPESTHETL